MIKLSIYNEEYNHRQGHIDEWHCSKEISKRIYRGHFKSYVDIANFLDAHATEYKNKIMFTVNSATKTLLGIKKVVFDGVQTYVEDRGLI